jgi:hypothetical protein
MPATAAWICVGVMLGKLVASRPHVYSATNTPLLGYAVGPLACRKTQHQHYRIISGAQTDTHAL